MARRTLDLPQEWAFAVVTAVRHHGLWIPATRVTAPPRSLTAGDVVVARTAGVFIDRMRVIRALPPTELALTKVGPVLLGDVSILVEPQGPARSTVVWTEDVHLRGPLPRKLTAAVLHPVLEVMTAFALWRIDRSVRRQRDRVRRSRGT